MEEAGKPAAEEEAVAEAAEAADAEAVAADENAVAEEHYYYYYYYYGMTILKCGNSGDGALQLCILVGQRCDFVTFSRERVFCRQYRTQTEKNLTLSSGSFQFACGTVDKKRVPSTNVPGVIQPLTKGGRGRGGGKQKRGPRGKKKGSEEKKRGQRKKKRDCGGRGKKKGSEGKKRGSPTN